MTRQLTAMASVCGSRVSTGIQRTLPWVTNDYEAGFVRAWYGWHKMVRPTTSFEAERGKAPQYDLECEIDHLASWAYQIGRAYLGGQVRDYVSQSASLLDDVRAALARGASECHGAESKDGYVEYLLHLKTILEIMHASEFPASGSWSE